MYYYFKQRAGRITEPLCVHYYTPNPQTTVVETKDMYIFKGTRETDEYVKGILAFHNFSLDRLYDYALSPSLEMNLLNPHLHDIFYPFYDKDRSLYSFGLRKEMFLCLDELPSEDSEKVFTLNMFHPVFFVPPTSL